MMRPGSNPTIRISVEQRALLALRAAVLCLMVPLAFEWGTRLHSMSSSLIPPDTPHKLVATWLFVAVAVLWFGAFGLMFRMNTARIEGAHPPLRPLVLLALQFLLAWGGSPELLILVALQAPLVLSGRRLAWFLSLTGLIPFAASLWDLVEAGFQVPADEIAFRPLPPVVGWTLTWVGQLAWMGFGATAGWMMARAVRSWRELLRANAEVRASREMLSENARVAERLHLSRELHDALGHHLAALSQHLELAWRRSEGEAAVAVARARELVGRLLERLRRAVSTMQRPPTLELGKALRSLADASTGVETEVSIPEDMILAPVRTEALFQCACEALGAAILAGGRPKMTLELRQRHRGHILTVLIAPGRALRLSEDALQGLRRRLHPLGGVLEAGVFEGAFRMQVDLPETAASV
jgi:signal transduction histidine kinase